MSALWRSKVEKFWFHSIGSYHNGCYSCPKQSGQLWNDWLHLSVYLSVSPFCLPLYLDMEWHRMIVFSNMIGHKSGTNPIEFGVNWCTLKVKGQEHTILAAAILHDNVSEEGWSVCLSVCRLVHLPYGALPCEVQLICESHNVWTFTNIFTMYR